MHCPAGECRAFTKRVSKSDFCVFHSDTGRTYSLENSATGFSELIANLGDGAGLLIALEPTGGCEWALWEALEVAGYEVRQVSAAHVRSFARSLGNLAKTDPLDARLIARFIRCLTGHVYMPERGLQAGCRAASADKNTA